MRKEKFTFGDCGVPAWYAEVDGEVIACDERLTELINLISDLRRRERINGDEVLIYKVVSSYIISF